MLSAERLRETVQHTKPIPEHTITVSIGLVARNHKESPEDWLKRADRLLYQAKENGRNIVIADDNQMLPLKIIWGSNMISNHSGIDVQHRMLYVQINRLIEGSCNNLSRENLIAQYREILDTLCRHEEEEEALFKNLHYQEEDIHRKNA